VLCADATVTDFGGAAMPRPEKVRLGEILLQQGLLTEQQLKEALDEQRKSGRRLGRVFVEKSFVSEEQISTALAKQLQVPYVNLKHFVVKPEVAMRLPEIGRAHV
jgi:MSHA biogenesis protein MshE